MSLPEFAGRAYVQNQQPPGRGLQQSRRLLHADVLGLGGDGRGPEQSAEQDAGQHARQQSENRRNAVLGMIGEGGK